jgi:hypothetical protein
MLGVTGVRVSVGQGVRVRVGVELRKGVRVGGMGVCVLVGRGVRVTVGVLVGRRVRVGVSEGTAVGASPSTVNTPEIFQIRPVKI